MKSCLGVGLGGSLIFGVGISGAWFAFQWPIDAFKKANSLRAEAVAPRAAIYARVEWAFISVKEYLGGTAKRHELVLSHVSPGVVRSLGMPGGS